MRLSFNIGSLVVSVSNTGGVRVGKSFGGTYMSTQVLKPTKKKKTPTKGAEIEFV